MKHKIIFLFLLPFSAFGQDTILLSSRAEYYSDIDSRVANYSKLKYHNWRHGRELIVFPDSSYVYELVFYLDGKRIKDWARSSHEYYKITGNQFYYRSGYAEELWEFTQLEDSLFFLKRAFGNTIQVGYAKTLVPFDKANFTFTTTSLTGDTLFQEYYKTRTRRNYQIERKYCYYEFVSFEIQDTIYKLSTFKNGKKITQIIQDSLKNISYQQGIINCSNIEFFQVYRIIITKDGLVLFEPYKTMGLYYDAKILPFIYGYQLPQPFMKNGEPVNVEALIPLRIRLRDH